MSYFILAIPSLNNVFSLLESGSEIRFKYSYAKEIPNFNKIKVNDLVIGYKKGIETIKYVFIVKKIDGDSITFEKSIDISEGYSIEDNNLKEKIEEEKCIELKTDEFKELYENLLKSIPTFDITEFEVHSDLKHEINFNLDINKLRNRIFFGAPGTGKSHDLNEEKDELLGKDSENYERVTFHPDYSYAQFVGTYKPVPEKDNETGKDIISYEYVAGPFMRVLTKAMHPDNKDNNYLLIIEEINRSNVAAVFGDVFQLLDRDDNNESEYPIQTSKDMRDHIAKELNGNPEDYKTIKIPSNMFIWATMNSADQGVFVLDSAFKRRWDFTYNGINHSEDKIKGEKIYFENGDSVEWNTLRKAINNEISSYGVNEDKLLGPFFIPLKHLKKGKETPEIIREIFKNKVLMYLFEDVAKLKKDDLFSNVKKNNEYLLYSEVCSEFDEKGIKIFCNNIIKECE